MKAVYLSFHSKLSGDPSPSVGTNHRQLHLVFDLPFSERAVQGVIVVFEVLQLQEVPGPLAALLH